MLHARQAIPGEINGDALDRFTAAHFAIGVGYGLAGLPWYAALGLALGWELVEIPLKDHAPQVFPRSSQDTVPNAICDVAAVMAGWAAGRKMRCRPSP